MLHIHAYPMFIGDKLQCQLENLQSRGPISCVPLLPFLATTIVGHVIMINHD